MADLRIKAYSAAALVFALDRLTKWLVESRVSVTDVHRVIPGFFDIVHSENRGVAFGIFNDSTFEWRTALLVLVSAIAVIAVSVMLWKPQRLDRPSMWGLALMLGGAAGNVFDRLVYGQSDGFSGILPRRPITWPTFNVADSAIVIGSGAAAAGHAEATRQAANVP